MIESTLGESAVADPVRAYVGVESEPLYATARSEMALEEMERLGAFDRKYLLLLSPTGTGWVDHTVVESAEILTRGDIATVAIQYGRAPSFVEVQNVSLGRAQFRQLLWGVRQRGTCRYGKAASPRGSAADRAQRPAADDATARKC